MFIARKFRPTNRLWTDVVFGGHARKAYLRIAVFALAPLVLGSLLSLAFGWSSQFHRNMAVYYGVIGIYLTTAAIWYGSNAQYDIYDRFLLCFDMPEETREKILQDTLSRYSTNVRYAWTGFVVFVAAGFIAYIGFFWPHAETVIREFVGISTLRFADFERAGWYDPDVATRAFLITLLFALFSAFPLATAFRLISRMPVVLFRSARKPILIMPRFIKPNFAKLTAFYTRISVLWICGATLVAVLFRADSSLFTIIFLVALLALGAANFVIPQLVYAHIVLKAEAHWLEKAHAAIESWRTRSTKARPTGSPTLANDEQDPENIVLEIDPYFLSADKWVYPVHETYLFVLAQGISFVGLAIDILIKVYSKTP